MLRVTQQVFRYGAVGLISNAALYGAYLLLTSLGAGPKSAMTVVFVSGVIITFVFNRNWSFAHTGRMRPTAVRYATAYGSIYLLNVGALALLVDRIGLPHSAVMLALIFVSAGLLFLTLRLWVFRVGDERPCRS